MIRIAPSFHRLVTNLQRPSMQTTAATDIDISSKRSRRASVLVFSTLSFTVLFAVWLMLGVLGLKIKAEPRLLVGDAAERLNAAELQAHVDARFEWLLSTAILFGAVFRLNFGLWAERFGGRKLMLGLLLFCAAPTAALAYADNFTELLVCAALCGLAGNSFSVGIAWNSAWFPPQTKGTALGIFGAGNVGAAGTKLLIVLAPALLTLVPAAGLAGGWIPGGWRVVPLFYAALLLTMAAVLAAFCPRDQAADGNHRPLREMLRPLHCLRVWRFCLYYVVVFGAYVALSAWLPSYYVAAYDVNLRTASLLTALFIFPASLLRPFGGWLSDKFGPRIVTYGVFLGMMAAMIPLCLPSSVLALGVNAFTLLITLVGVGMGIGKASVFKYIPDYFPRDVGAVGGVVGMMGAFGGFFLPKVFGWSSRQLGYPQAAFVVLLLLTTICLAWLHKVVVGIWQTEQMAATRAPVLRTSS